MTIPPEILNPLKSFWIKYCWVILIVISALILAYCSVLILGKNNPIEIGCEKVIEKETGISLELSP